MALKTINVNYNYKPPVSGYYVCILELFDIASLHINIYDDLGLLQVMSDVRNYYFYFQNDSMLSFRGTIIIEENSKYSFSIQQFDFGEIKPKCTHNWVEYIGFTDTFTYCSKCDIKDRQ